MSQARCTRWGKMCAVGKASAGGTGHILRIIFLQELLRLVIAGGVLQTRHQ